MARISREVPGWYRRLGVSSALFLAIVLAVVVLVAVLVATRSIVVVFGGHPEMAHNIPLVFPKFDPEGPTMPGRPPGCTGEPNPDFVAVAKERFDPTDKILVFCATGGRGAMAANALADAGFTSVYNIVNGFEGDRVDDPGSVYHGKHMRNGWKNLGLPWGYEHHPDLMWEAPDN